MKKIISSPVIFLLLFIISCKKPDNEPAAHINSFSAVVNGTPYIATKVDVLYGGSSVPGSQQVNIYATDAAGLMVTLVIIDYNGSSKTFNQLSSFGSVQLPYTLSSFSTTFQLILSSIDNSKYSTGEIASGTFHFDSGPANGSYNVTAGNFSVFVKH